jgi:hypothetical protein
VTSAVPLIQASGDPFDVGYAHGAARADALHAFLDDHLCRINLLVPAPVSLDSLGPTLAAYSDAIAAVTPRLSEEIDGLASGAGLSREQAVLLQVRREIIGYQRIPTRGDCTTYASLANGPGGGPVLAQTVDLNGNLDDQIAVLEVGLSGSPRRALVLSFGGLLGYLGVNSDGLAIGLNLVLGGQWRPGLTPYLAIRHLLDTAGSVDEALDILRGLPLASSRSLTLCDRERVASVEILDNEQRLIDPALAAQSAQAGAAVRSAATAQPASTAQPTSTAQPGGPALTLHTNHFLHPDFTSQDELNIFARNSSKLRLKACAAGLDELAGAPTGADVEARFDLFTKPPVCTPDTGDIRRERTVAAVVLRPDLGELHLRPGDPSRSVTQAFRLDRSLQRQVVA